MDETIGGSLTKLDLCLQLMVIKRRLRSTFFISLVAISCVVLELGIWLAPIH